MHSEHQLTSRPLLKDKQQQTLSLSAGTGNAATTAEAGSPKPAAIVQGTAESAEGSRGATALAATPTSTSSSPSAQGPFLIHSAASWDQRVSGLGPKLDAATLHGGWQLTRGGYDVATRHPNATVLSHHSPRVLLVHDFLAPDEVDHLIGIAAGMISQSMCLLAVETQPVIARPCLRLRLPPADACKAPLLLTPLLLVFHWLGR